MSINDLKSMCSVRGRVAFVLAISEQLISSLNYSNQVFGFARKALDDAWKWEEGEPIDGDQLDFYLENPTEESIAVFGCNPPESGRAAIMAITSAMAYVIWHAYQKDGIENVSGVIHEVDESVIDEVVEYAKESPEFHATILDRLSKYLVSQSRVCDPSELGSPIPRSAVLAATQSHM